MTKTTEELKRLMYLRLGIVKDIAEDAGASPSISVRELEDSLESYLKALRTEANNLRTDNAQKGDALTSLKGERDDLRNKLQAFEFANKSAGELLRDALTTVKRQRDMIDLTPAEIQSGYSRVQWAEALILQLPDYHEGRNSWLMNYGEGKEAKAFAQEWHRENCEIKTERDCYKRSSEGRESQLADALETIRRQREFIRTLYTSRKARKSKPRTLAQIQAGNAPKTKCGGVAAVTSSYLLSGCVHSPGPDGNCIYCRQEVIRVMGGV